MITIFSAWRIIAIRWTSRRSVTSASLIGVISAAADAASPARMAVRRAVKLRLQLFDAQLSRREIPL